MANKKLNYQIEIDEKGAIKSIKNLAGETKKAAKGMSKDFSLTGNIIKGNLVSKGIELAIAKTKQLVSQTLTYGDRLGKLNVRLGVSVSQLDKLRQIADLSGIEFNTLTMSMQRLQRRVAEAANGSGEAVKALEELNINARELTRLPLDQQLLRVAEAIDKLNDNGTKTRLTMKLMDSEGVSLIQMFGGLTKKMDETSSAFTTKGVKAIEQFNDNITMLTEDMKGPFIETLTEVLEVLNKMFVLYNKNKDVFGDITKMGVSLATSLPGLREVKIVGKHLKARREAIEAQGPFKIGPETEGYGAYKADFEAIPSNWLSREINPEKIKQLELIDTTEMDILEAQMAINKAEAAYTSQLIDAQDNMGIILEQQNKWKDGNEKLTKSQSELNEQLAMGGSVVAYDLAGGFWKALEAGKSFGEGLSDTFKQVFVDLGKLILQQELYNALLGKEYGRGGNVGGLVGMIGGLFAKGGVFSGGKITAFAKGGIVNQPTIFPMANGMGLVGEAGPEAVMPLKEDSDGNLGVISNSTGAQVINYYINAIDTQSFHEAVMRNPASITKVVNNALERGDQQLRTNIRRSR